MRGWKERWYTFTSFLICVAVVVLGSLLYPLVLLFFGTVALLHPAYRRIAARAGRRRADLVPLLAALVLAGSLTSCGGSKDAPPPAPSPPPPREGASDPLVLPPDATRWVNEGVAEYRQGRYHDAAAAFEKARDQVPADARVSNLLGTALLQAKLHTPAREEFLRMLALQPEAVEPRLGLARIGIRRGEYDVAASLFREVLARDPGNLLALYNLGLLRYRAADYKEAQSLLSRLLQLKPDHPEAHYTLGLTYARLGDDARAEEQFLKTVQNAPDNSQAHFNLAKLYERSGRAKEAAAEGEVFRRLSDRMAADRAAESTARDLYLAGDYEAALKEYDRLLELNPRSGRFPLGKGLCFLWMGRRNEAIAAFVQAAAADPRLPPGGPLSAAGRGGEERKSPTRLRDAGGDR